MHIKDDLTNGDDSEYFTPKHAPSAVTSTINIAAAQSQDSVDVFHDAYSMMIHSQRGSNISLNQRRRHASMPQHVSKSRPVINGALADCDISRSPIEPKRRVRHSSCSTAKPTTPDHVPRLSFSTNSIRRNTIESNGVFNSNTTSNDSIIKIPPPPIVPKLSPLKLTNYVACQDVDSKLLNAEHFRNSLSPVIENRDCTDGSSIEDMDKKPTEMKSSPGAWARNYVMCVETEGMIKDEVIQFCDEAQLKDNHDQTDSHTFVHMYTFDTVKRQRKPNLNKIKDEFSTSYLNLEHNAPHLFVSSQWQQPSQLSCVYLGYRLFWAMYFLMWGLWSWNGSMGYGAPFSLQVYYLLYMTNWGLWTLVFDTNLQAINCILHFKKLAYEGDPRYPRMKKLLKISWVLSNTTSSIHLFITAAYWITVYPLRTDQSINEIGINVHLIPGLYILIDVAVSATPRRLLHAYHPMGFITTYYLFNFTYFMAGGLDYLGGPSLYPAMDWSKPGPTIAIMLGGIFVLTPLLHAFICGLYAARIKIWRILKISRYTREENDDEKISRNPQSLDI